jgi:transposase
VDEDRLKRHDLSDEEWARRNVAERAFCQLRQYHAVATRYDKRDYAWRETVDVASIRIWLRHPVS